MGGRLVLRFPQLSVRTEPEGPRRRTGRAFVGCFLGDHVKTAIGTRIMTGTVVGTETYRWLIFTSGKGLVDGSYYRLPCWGCYTVDGTDIETHGVAPDVVVDLTVKDKDTGQDPQLDKAIEIIMDQLK